MQPIIIRDSISIAAGATNENVIASNPSLRRFLRSPFLASGRLTAVISATGLRIALDYGSKNVVDNSDLRVATFADEDFDTIARQWFPNEGDQLVLRAFNPTGGAISLIYRLVLTPLSDISQLMPDRRVVQRIVSVAAAAVDTVIYDGSRYERPPVDCILDVLETSSAAGLSAQVYVEQDNIAPPGAVKNANRVPQVPQDISVEDVEVPQDKLIQVLVSNSTGGALSYFGRLELEELQRT